MEIKKSPLFTQGYLGLNWKPITDGDQKVDEVQFRVIPKFVPANAQSELYIHTAFMGPDVTVKKEDGIYSATFYNLGKGKAVELYGLLVEVRPKYLV